MYTNNETLLLQEYHEHYEDHDDSLIHYETQGHGKGVHLIQVHTFDHVRTPMTICSWFFFITIAKILFHRFSKINILPDSAMLLVFGGVFGTAMHFLYPNEEFYLQPEWFFLFLLPPIALEAGFFLPNKDFFRNFGTITTYAVLGTIFNIATIGLTLFLFRGYFLGSPSGLHLLLFATLISAVDPVAVICVFEEIHVNQLLYICVFGESLLNDAVTIVLYHNFNSMAAIVGDNNNSTIMFVDYATATSSFFVVSFGGIFIGVVWALITGLTTRFATEVNVVQPLICFIFPYMAYLLAETLSLSSMLAIVVCGLLMKQYIAPNISKKSLTTIKYFLKTISSSCEAFIFVYLGMSTISNNHEVDIVFILVTLVSCFVYRFIGVILLTYLLNIKRQEKISIVDQFIMGYGGIRGAVCYGLVMSIDIGIVPSRNMFATTTIIVILFTVFVQGGTIKSLVKYLKVKHADKRKKMLFEMLTENVNMHMMAGIEIITGLRGHYRFRISLMRFNQDYIQPFIMGKQVDKGSKLVKHNEDIQVKEAVNYFKKHGSFIGMPTVGSNPFIIDHTEVELQKKHVRIAPMRRIGHSRQSTPSVPLSGGIPRKISMRSFVQEKLDEIKSSHQTYSRHFLESDLFHRLDTIELDTDDNNNKENEVESTDAAYKTYPYSRSSQKDMVIDQMRKISQISQHSQPSQHSLKDHNHIEIPEPVVINMEPRSISPRNLKPILRPRFMISTDSMESDDHHPLHSSDSPPKILQLDSPPPKEHVQIGRFEVKTDDGLKVPKFTRSNSIKSKSSEENNLLLPIEEQEEKIDDDDIIPYLSDTIV